MDPGEVTQGTTEKGLFLHPSIKTVVLLSKWALQVESSVPSGFSAPRSQQCRIIGRQVQFYEITDLSLPVHLS